MKKYFIAILVILTFAFCQKNSFGQTDSTFAPPNAEWWFDLDYGMFTYKLNTKVLSDTIIQGIAAKKVEQVSYQRTWLALNTFTIDTFPPTYFYIYDNIDTVFIFNINFNKFTPLFVFNVGVGDTVCLPVLGSDLRPNPIANGDTCFCFQIDSIGKVLYDTTYLTTYFQHALFDSTNFNAWPVYNWCFSHTGGILEYTKAAYAKKIGGLVGGFFPMELNNGIAKPTMDTLTNPYYDAFRCYEEDSFAIHIFKGSNNNCYFDQPTAIALMDSNLDFIQAYPNPNNGLLTLEASSPFEQKTIISIADLSGRVLKSWKAPTGRNKIELNVKDLSPGLYLLRFETGGGMLFRKVVVQ